MDGSLRTVGDRDIGTAVVWGMFTRRFLTRYQAKELPIGSEAESLLIDVFLANAAPMTPSGKGWADFSGRERLRRAADLLIAQRARARARGPSPGR